MAASPALATYRRSGQGVESTRALLGTRPFAGGWRLVCVLLMLPGCYGARTARIYDVSTGQASTIAIDREWEAGGSLKGVLPTGEHCTGSFGDISGTKSGVLDCEGRLLECSLAARDMTDVGFGTCHDGKGGEYDVFF